MIIFPRLIHIIGNAKIEGLEDSLNMAGTDYNVAVGIFFVPYVLCEVPSNVLLSKFKKPSWYMGFLVVSWGIVSLYRACYSLTVLISRITGHDSYRSRPEFWRLDRYTLFTRCL